MATTDLTPRHRAVRDEALGAGAPEPSDLYTKAQIAVLGLCTVVASTSFLLYLAALGHLASRLVVSHSEARWVVLASFLGATVSAASFAVLARSTGVRRLLLISMASLAAGSALSALASAVWAFLVGQVLASFGLASISLSAVVASTGRADSSFQRGAARIVGLQAVGAAVGFAVGGVTEGILRADWRWAAWSVAICAVLAGFLVARVLPEGRPPRDHRAALGGPTLLVLGLVALLVPFAEGSPWPWAWSSDRGIALLVFAAAALAAGTNLQLRSPRPLLHFQALQRPDVVLGLIVFAALAVTAVIVGATVPAFVQAPGPRGSSLHASALAAELYLVPSAAMAAIGAWLSGRWADCLSARVRVVVGLVSAAIALGALVMFHASTWQVVLTVATFGAGLGATLTAAYQLILTGVSSEASGTVVALAVTSGGASAAVAHAIASSMAAHHIIVVGHAVYPATVGYENSWGIAALVAGAAALAVTSTSRRNESLRRNARGR